MTEPKNDKKTKPPKDSGGKSEANLVIQEEGDSSSREEALKVAAKRLSDDRVKNMTIAMESIRKKTEKGEMQGLTSTATTVSSNLASQWLDHMKRTFKRHSIALSEEQQLMLKKMVTDELYPLHGSTDIAAADILMLYTRGLEAHHDGRYREMFSRIRPCVPFYNTNVLVWIRISEALVYEFYEEVWEFADIYTRLFEKFEHQYTPSVRRRCNELRPRHEDMNMNYAETATLIMFSLAKNSIREPVHYSATALRTFLLLKQKRFTEALETVDFAIKKYDKNDGWVENLAVLLTYKTEGLLGIGRYNRAIEYCLRIMKESSNQRVKQRATMLIAMAYMRKNNFKKAHEYVLSILNEERLDEHMMENIALLGLNLAHLMGNVKLLKKFEHMLQLIVY